MSNPQQETKIELVTEAIESLTRAVVAHQNNPATPRACYDNVVAARGEVAAALRELLTPTLRAFDGGQSPGAIRKLKPEVVQFGGKGIDGMNLG